MWTQVISASVQGDSHKRTNKECQDSLKAHIIDDIAILAAADGHGSDSCPHSRTGAEVAVETFCDILNQYIHDYSNDYDALISLLNREGETTIARAIDNEWKHRIDGLHKTNNREMPLTDDGDIDHARIWRLYGTTLLGLVITPLFYFAFQLGDGDIILLHENSSDYAVQGDKLLGTETHSLCHIDAWKKAIANVRRHPEEYTPYAFMLSTDGFANSYPSEAEFLQTCVDYYSAIREHGANTVESNLGNWLDETSASGSGDDITVLFALPLSPL